MMINWNAMNMNKNLMDSECYNYVVLKYYELIGLAN